MMDLLGKSWRPALLILSALAVFLALRYTYFEGSYEKVAD